MGVRNLEILNRLYALESVECSKYEQEDNEFVYACLHSDNESIKRAALDTVSKGMMKYISTMATNLIYERGKVGNLSIGYADDIIAEGYAAFASYINHYDPKYNTKISSYITPHVRNAIESAIDRRIKDCKLTDQDRNAMKFIAKTKKILLERGIEEPTSSDYYFLAIEQGKNKKKYTLSLFENILRIMDTPFSGSIEEMMESGIQINSEKHTDDEVIQNDSCERIYGVIDKLGYFEKLAIESRIEAVEPTADSADNKSSKKQSENDSNIYSRAYMIFKKKSGLAKISKTDFIRLLSDAQTELSKRMNRRQSIKKKQVMFDNELRLDESFDTYFADSFSIDANTINNTKSIEFEQRYAKTGS